MSLLKSVKKLVKKFNFEAIEHIIIFNFKEILFLIVLFFIIVIVIMIFILSDQEKSLKNKKEKEPEKKIEKTKIEKERFNYSKDILLSVNDFLLPDIKTFDLTFDYIEILPNKYYTTFNIELLKKDYETFFSTIKEKDLKFDFEKRDEKKFNTK